MANQLSKHSMAIGSNLYAIPMKMPMIIILNNQDLIAISNPSWEKQLCNQDILDVRGRQITTKSKKWSLATRSYIALMYFMPVFIENNDH
jgi:hypothetical protein